MIFEPLLVPNLGRLMVEQGPVAWIYVALLVCLTVRLWVSLRLLTLGPSGRARLLSRAGTMVEAVANIALLLGVMGTLIGVALAISGMDGSVSPEDFIETFSRAFGAAVGTTLAGGSTYIACLLLSSLESWLLPEEVQP